MRAIFPILILLFLPFWASAGENDYKVSGLVFGARDKKPKEGVLVVAYRIKRDLEGRLVYKADSEKSYAFSDGKGKFSINLSGKFEYMIEFVKDGYLFESFVMDKKLGIAEGEHIKLEIPIRKGDSILLSETYVDKETGKPIPNVEVSLFDMADSVTKTFMTNAEGEYFFTIQKEGQYLLSGKHNEYFHSNFDSLTIRIKNFEDFKRRITLQKIKVGYKQNLGDLNYGINAVSLSKDGKNKLDELVDIMVLNPGISIELACHTDSRGDDDYNLELSQKRADRISAYLQTFGVSKSRIMPKGYGETQLLNECTNGVFCETAKHAENRRVEFEILKVKK